MAHRAGEALRSAALAGVSLLIALALAEGIVRALDLGPAFHVVFRETVQPSSNPVLEYELRPGARDGRERINGLGLRDVEPTPRLPGALRIAAIGDSVTYGSGLPRAASWTEQLERLLARGAGPDGSVIEVWNLGVPGYNATQVVERLREAGLPLGPDAVIYGYVLNDPQAYSLEAAALRRMREEARARATTAPVETGVLGRLLARSRVYLWTRYALARAAPGPRHPEAMPGDPAYDAARRGDAAGYLRALHDDAASWSRVEQAFDALAALTAPRHLPVLVAVFPMLPADSGEDRLDDVRARVVAAARARGFAAVDLAPAFRGASAVRSQLDFLHPNAAGQRIAARAILAALCAADLLPRRPAACDEAAAAGLRSGPE